MTEPTERVTPIPAPDLTVNKVIAGAAAAATSAALGSYFGAAGTVAGAAVGSVASTVTTVFYQRSLDRTREKLVGRIRLTPSRRPDVADGPPVVPAPREAPEAATEAATDAETVRLHVEPEVRPRRRRTWAWACLTALVFLGGLLGVTAIELAKGSTLATGETGTSVGRVISGNRAGAVVPTEEPTPTATPEPTSDSPVPTETSAPDEPDSTRSAEPTPSDSPESGATPTPTVGNRQTSSAPNGGD